VRKLALLLIVAITVLSVIVGWVWPAHRASEVEKAVLSTAEAGAFPPAGAFLVPGSDPYDGQIECRVEEVEAFQGQDLYLCKLGVKGLDGGGEYIYAAMVAENCIPTRRSLLRYRRRRSIQASRASCTLPKSDRRHAAICNHPGCVKPCRRICLITSRGTRSDEMQTRRPHRVRSERSRMSPVEPQGP
jgi:hypothetical protein